MMWGRITAAGLVLGWWAFACGRTGLFVLPTGEGNDAAAIPDARENEADASGPGVSDVTGNVIVHYSTDTGVVDQGLDLTSTDVVAYAELGDGGFDTIAGTGNADGSFVVRAVPNGPFQLRVGTTVLVHPPRSVVVDCYAAGRPDATYSTGQAIGTVQLDNVAPWQATFPDGFGELMIMSSNAAATGLVLFGTEPPPGSTSIRATNVEVGLDSPAIDSTRGDRATLVQWNTRDDAGRIGTEPSFVRSMDLPNPMFGMKLGSYTIAGTLQPVAATQTIPTAWDGPSFVPYAPRVAPGASKTTRVLSVEAAPNALPPGASLPILIANHRRTYGWTLVDLEADANDTSTPSTLSFGNPFPSWSLWTYAAFDVAPTLTAPDVEGGTYSVHPRAGFTRFTPLASFGAAPIEPMLTPPGDVRIDGVDVLGALPPVGPTPTFTWTPAMSLDPAFDNGRLSYVVGLWAMTSDPDVPSYLFGTTETRVVVPPALLQQGVSYYASVAALASPGADPANPAYDTATVVTSVFTP
jgi:hypothetical protein